jgi:formylglycine-generating enzyme required for sulfatase activity
MPSPIRITVAGALFAGVVLAFLGSAPESPADVPKVEFKLYTEKIADTDVSFEMIPIPAGTFEMGSPKDEKGRGDDEGPQHPVQIKAFWMGKCEVTWDEYDLFRKELGVEERNDQIKLLAKEADALTGPTPPYADETFDHGREGKPVLGITYHGAMTYCRWLSKKTGKYYRLPTEAEWEYACRAGTKTAYFFGDDPKQLDEYAWYAMNSKVPGEMMKHPQPVGKKKPNPWGLHDMLGNVAEWCVDHYDASYYAKFPLDRATLEPVYLPTGSRYPFVARGGSWADQARECRSAARRGSDKSWLKQDPQRPQSIWWMTEADYVGFRVVRGVDDPDNLKNLRSKITWQSKNEIENK